MRWRDLDGGWLFADGAWLVGLAPLADAAPVPQETAAALGVREEAGRPVLETMQEALRPRRLLLVLDNCEHLVEACAELADALLHACPLLIILATSREALNVAGEQRLHAALAVWRRLGNRTQIASALFLLGRLELLRGERAAARPLFMEGLACAEAARDRWVESLIWVWLAQVAFDEGDEDAARAWAEQVLAGVQATGWHRNACFALRLLGDVEARQGSSKPTSASWRGGSWRLARPPSA